MRFFLNWWWLTFLGHPVCFIGIRLRLLVCWTAHESTNIDDGRPVSSANSVAECQQACLDDHECTGVDWNQRGPQEGKCWKSGPWSGDRNEDASTDVTHYDLDRNCIAGTCDICILKQPSQIWVDFSYRNRFYCCLWLHYMFWWCFHHSRRSRPHWRRTVWVTTSLTEQSHAVWNSLFVWTETQAS